MLPSGTWTGLQRKSIRQENKGFKHHKKLGSIYSKIFTNHKHPKDIKMIDVTNIINTWLNNLNIMPTDLIQCCLRANLFTRLYFVFIKILTFHLDKSYKTIDKNECILSKIIGLLHWKQAISSPYASITTEYRNYIYHLNDFDILDYIHVMGVYATLYSNVNDMDYSLELVPFNTFHQRKNSLADFIWKPDNCTANKICTFTNGNPCKIKIGYRPLDICNKIQNQRIKNRLSKFSDKKVNLFTACDKGSSEVESRQLINNGNNIDTGCAVGKCFGGSMTKKIKKNKKKTKKTKNTKNKTKKDNKIDLNLSKYNTTKHLIK